jgi:signal transduction histidine kinase
MSGIQSKASWFVPTISLRWRLVVIYIGLFVVFVTILSIFLYSSIAHMLFSNAKAALPQHTRELRAIVVQEMCSNTPPESLESFRQEANSIDISEIYLLDQTGTVIASTDHTLLQRSLPNLKPSPFTSQAVAMPQYFKGTTAAGEGGDGYFLPITAQTNCQSTQQLPTYIAVLTSYSSEQNTLRILIFTLIVISVIMIVVGTTIISLTLGILLKPLKQMVQVIQALAQGDLRQRVQVAGGRNEIATLGTSFNQMADRFEQMFTAHEDSEKRSRRFVSDASHELRTPITSLRGFTEVLLRGAKDDPATTQRVLGLMKIEAERMSDLVNDLLTLARLDEGHFPAPTPIDLVDIAVECLQVARKEAPINCKLSLELAVQERLTIPASHEPLVQMLMSLLRNAIRYGCTGEEKNVLVCLDKRNERVLIQVIDHGEGILPNDLPHIFDRFYRGANAHTSKKSNPGTGLGLPIAQAIAQAYQGSVTVCSEPNHETVFTVSFPTA